MRIDGVRIRELQLRLKLPFETSFGTTWERRVLLVEVHSNGVTGWGEITSGLGPFYSAETVDTSWITFREFFAPLVVGKSLATATELPRLLEPIRGHEMTRAGIETALWDVGAQQKGVALSKLLGGGTRQSVSMNASTICATRGRRSN